MTISENGQTITKDILCSKRKNGIHVYWGRGGKSCGLSQHLGHPDTRLTLHLVSWAPNPKSRHNKTKLANEIQATVKESWVAQFAANNQGVAQTQPEERQSAEELHIDDIERILGIEDYNDSSRKVDDDDDVISPAPLSPSQGQPVDEDGEMLPEAALEFNSLDDTERMATREAQLRDKEDRLYSILYMALHMHVHCLEGVIELFEYSELEERVGLLGEVYTLVDVTVDQTLPQPL